MRGRLCLILAALLLTGCAQKPQAAQPPETAAVQTQATEALPQLETALPTQRVFADADLVPVTQYVPGIRQELR